MLVGEAEAALQSSTYYGALEASSSAIRAQSEMRDALIRLKGRIGSKTREKARILHASIEADGKRGGIRQGRVIMILGACTSLWLANAPRMAAKAQNDAKALVRKHWIDSVDSELRRNGYDPKRLSDAQFNSMGYRMEDVPPIGREPWVLEWLMVVSIGGVATYLAVRLVRIGVASSERSRLSRNHEDMVATLARIEALSLTSK